ncbi:MAG: agmatinase [Nitrososphaerota archaeon]
MGYAQLYLSGGGGGWGSGPGLRFFGAPYEATTSFRPGCRFGPAAFRQALMNVEVYSPSRDFDLEERSVRDLGDFRAQGEFPQVRRALGALCEELLREPGPVLMVGGEHLLTLGSFPASGAQCLLVFDAHLDLREELHGLRYSHATFLRRLMEEGAAQLVHVGARAASRAEWEEARRLRARLHPLHALDARAAKELRDELSPFSRLYLSVDLDVFDPSEAPGVGNPEAGGLRFREFVALLEALEGKEVRLFDIVELCPPYDAGGITSCLAAKVAVEVAARLL